MSTLVAQTISNGTVSTSSANVIQGSAKAWVNFNGQTASPSTIRASYNVTSITKNATGDYTVNFTNAFSDTNYTTVASGSSSNSPSSFAPFVAVYSSQSGESAPTTTTARISTRNSANSATDYPYMNVACFR